MPKSQIEKMKSFFRALLETSNGNDSELQMSLDMIRKVFSLTYGCCVKHNFCFWHWFSGEGTEWTKRSTEFHKQTNTDRQQKEKVLKIFHLLNWMVHHTFYLFSWDYMYVCDREWIEWQLFSRFPIFFYFWLTTKDWW